MRNGERRVEAGRSMLIKTRKEVESGWRATHDILVAQGHVELAAHLHRFLDQMSPPRIEREHLAAALVERRRIHTVSR